LQCFLYFISFCSSIFKIQAKKGNIMSVIIKNAETLFGKFETKMELWAEKIF